MFFVATDLKEVLVCTNGKCTSAVRTGKPIVSLLFDDNRDTLVTLTEDLMLLQNRVNTYVHSTIFVDCCKTIF